MDRKINFLDNLFLCTVKFKSQNKNLMVQKQSQTLYLLLYLIFTISKTQLQNYR